jgi:acyl-CoA reductase-like NAD-dependent aldehyde dehydrogenase
MENKPVVIANFINNVFVPTAETIDSFSPINGKLICQVPDSGAREADMAVEVLYFQII